MKKTPNRRRLSRFSFDGLAVDLQRNGTAVTGRVHFPESSGKQAIPIDFKIKRRAAVNVSSATEPLDGHTEAVLTSIAQDAVVAVADHRSIAVRKYHACVAASPNRNRLEIAEQVAKGCGCSSRALQMCVRKASIADTLTKPVRDAIYGDDVNIKPAIQVCAYWCYRIGNLPTIDTRHVRLALDLVRKQRLEDVLAVIDFYYSYDCNRIRYPFKRLSNWLRYEFDKWLFRAYDADTRRQARAASEPPKHFVKPGPPRVDPAEALRTRQLDVRSRGHWIRAEAPSSKVDLADVGRAARQANRMGLPDVADALIRSSAPEPATLDQALQRMPDGFRIILLNASKGDSRARHEAIATQAVWFDQLPQDVRNNAKFMVDAWVRDHPESKALANARRVDIVVRVIRTRGKKTMEKIGR